MNRRRFLHHSAWLAAGAIAAPALFSSCKKTNLFESESFSGEVIVVGAGIAGLYAAELLIQQGVNVRIIESTNRWGGRMRSLPNITNDRLNIEQRTVQGQFSALYDLLINKNVSLQEPPLQELFYFNGRLNTPQEATQNTFFLEMLNVIAGFNNYSGADISALDYYNALNMSENTTHIFNVLTGQVHGTSSDHISGVGLAKQHHVWTAGDKKFRVSTEAIERACANAFARAINTITYDTSIASIDYTQSKINITSSTGETWTCDKVLVTVPLDVLKNGSIAFTPSLGDKQIQALSRISIDHSYCALMKLDTPQWPLGTTRIYGSGIVQCFDVNDDGWIYAEASGTQADTISSIFGETLDIFKNQLDNILPGAAAHIIEGYVQQWNGNRSFDAPGIGNSRATLAESIGEKLYFAGEATHTGGHHGTLHGAMETGWRAVYQMLEKSAS